MGIKRTQLDALFSTLVRERAGWTCESCGRDYSHDTVQVHCAHIIGRKVIRLRHDPRNAVCLCASCHAYYTDRPLEWSAYVRKELGDTVCDELQRLSNEIQKRPKGWEKDAKAHYRQELKRLEVAKAENYKGRFEFVGYW